MSKGDTTFEVSSGNVFAEFGLPDADELLVKADLAIAITRAVQARKLTQARAAAVLGVTQPKVSALVRGHLEGFSIERLLHYLRLLQQNVTIVVSDTPRQLSVGTARVLTNQHGAPTYKRAPAKQAHSFIWPADLRSARKALAVRTAPRRARKPAAASVAPIGAGI